MQAAASGVTGHREPGTGDRPPRASEATSVLGRWIDEHAGRVIAGLLTAMLVAGSSGVFAVWLGWRDVQTTVVSKLDDIKTELSGLGDLVDELRMTRYTAAEAKQLEAKIDARLDSCEQRMTRIEAMGGAR